MRGAQNCDAVSDVDMFVFTCGKIEIAIAVIEMRKLKICESKHRMQTARETERKNEMKKKKWGTKTVQRERVRGEEFQPAQATNLHKCVRAFLSKFEWRIFFCSTRKTKKKNIGPHQTYPKTCVAKDGMGENNE